ncbi:hypothetical protein GCM10009779_07260 [Polymorphospora rubra]
MLRNRNSSGQVLKSAARDGDSDGCAGTTPAAVAVSAVAVATVSAVMHERLFEGYDGRRSRVPISP